MPFYGITYEMLHSLLKDSCYWPYRWLCSIEPIKQLLLKMDCVMLNSVISACIYLTILHSLNRHDFVLIKTFVFPLVLHFKELTWSGWVHHLFTYLSIYWISKLIPLLFYCYCIASCTCKDDTSAIVLFGIFRTLV